MGNTNQERSETAVNKDSFKFIEIIGRGGSATVTFLYSTLDLACSNESQ